jgi:hypothetical protein
MRFFHIALLAGSLAIALPAAAADTADHWAPAAKQKFVQDCVASASIKAGPEAAKTMCECSANAAGKKMSTEDLAKLNGPASNANEKVRAELLEATQSCRMKS